MDSISTLRGEKLNYKYVAKEISKPPFLAPEVQWASKFTVFVRFTFSLRTTPIFAMSRDHNRKRLKTRTERIVFEI